MIFNINKNMYCAKYNIFQHIETFLRQSFTHCVQMGNIFNVFNA